LLSALLIAGIAALAFPGIFENYGGIVSISVQILLCVAILFTVFILFFFCLNLRKNLTAKIRPPNLAADLVSTDFISVDAVHVESLAGLSDNFFIFRQPFAFTSSNPELLQGADGEVVYEEDGIHYINNSVFANDERGDGFDNSFAKLVESVVNKKEFILE